MGRIRKSPAHLLRVGTTYHFRFRTPPKYVGIISGEIRLSLKTGALVEARSKAAMLRSLAVHFLDIRMKGNWMPMNNEEIRAELGKYLRKKLEEHENARLDRSSPSSPRKIAPKAMLATVGEVVRCRLTGETQQGKVNVKGFLEEAGIKNIPEGSGLYKYAERELLKLYQALIGIEMERSEGRYNTKNELALLDAYPVSNSIEAHPRSKKKSIKSKRLSKVIDQFVSENESDKKWSPKSIKDYGNRLNLLLDVMGNTPMLEIDYDKTRQFFDTIKRLPANRNKIKEYRRKSIDDLINLKLPRNKCMSDQTINNIMQAISNLFAWAVRREMIPQNYASTLRIKKTERPDEVKEIFNNDDLTAIFDGLSAEHGYRFWIALIGLYTGARLEEICQLYIDDLKMTDGIWCIDFNYNDEKHLKNVTSKRVVPVHKKLIEKGFPEYVDKIKKDGHVRLFSDLKRVGTTYGHSVSKWFSGYLKRIRLKSPERKISFHSFRHTFVTAAKMADLPEEYVKELVGHSNPSITYGVYGKPYDLTKLKSIIDKIEFEIE